MSDRNSNYVSNRVFLCNASWNVIKDKYEAQCLNEYKALVEKVNEAYEEINNIQREIRSQSKQSKIDELEASIRVIRSNIAKYDRELLKMESEYPLRYVLQRIKENPQAERRETIQVRQVPQEVQPKKSEEPQKAVGKKTKHLNKRTIIIASCVILAIIIALTVALLITGTGKNEYTITFYNNKGVYFTTPRYNDYKEIMHTEYQDNTVYKVEKFSGGYPSEPTPPQNEGYVFLGWYQNPECTDKFVFGHYEINSDINLYAKWGK